MRHGLLLSLGLTLSTMIVSCAADEDNGEVYSPSAGGADAGKGGSAGKPSTGGGAGAPSSGGAGGQAGQGTNGGAAGQPSSGGAAGANGGAAGASGGAAGEGGSAGATGGAAGDAGAAGSPGTGGSGGPVDCWSTGYSGNCDPVNNDCSGGMACDLMEDWEGYLVLECVSDGPQKAGESCDDENGPYCAERLHCNAVKGVCQKFCCSDADCSGVGGTCNPIDSNADGLGLCE